MNDVRGLKHNLNSRFSTNPDSFLANYSWDENTILTAEDSWRKDVYNWNGKTIKIYDLRGPDYELGFAIEIDGKFEYLISIYEPHGCKYKNGLITLWGHENIINIFLETGEIDKINTR